MAKLAFKFVFFLFFVGAVVGRKAADPDEDAEKAADAAIADADAGSGGDAQVQPEALSIPEPSTDSSTNDLSTDSDVHDHPEVATSTTSQPAQLAVAQEHKQAKHHHHHKKQLLLRMTNASVEAKVAADAHNAHEAAEVAKRAANVANKVAKHSTVIVTDAQSALRHAQSVLHATRVNSEGLSEDQQKELRTAEDKLNQATKKAEYGTLKNGRYVKAETTEEQKRMEKQLGKLQDKLDSMRKDGEGNSELGQMREELNELQQRLAEKRLAAANRHDALAKSDEEEIAELEKDLRELEEMIEALEKEEQGKTTAHQSSHDELKAEIEKLREQIEAMKYQKESTEDRGDLTYSIPEKKAAPRAPMKPMKGAPEEDTESTEPPAPMEPLPSAPRAPGPPEAPLAPLPEDQADAGGDDTSGVGGYAPPPASRGRQEVTATGGVDVDTEMPYGELEPFGREDTAQELTESSIQESDEMVDQLERAEVAEEKRAVFRALTRLRGAAITSFDGVARSQTGNIDEYNKLNKWRSTHPLHHLADEESDISKWAFPDNAD